tara:strand:+ start:171 stop:416 length:246 start_codon:yes stop_codon:yes gene_type:complete
MDLHKFAAIYDRLNNQPHLQELISTIIIQEYDNIIREETQLNYTHVFQELRYIIDLIHLSPHSDFILDGSTNIGQYIIYIK